MASVVVLGGGFGGAAAALTARELLPAEHQVTVVDNSATSYLCGVNPAVIVGEQEPLSRSLSDLTARGIKVLEAEITGIDTSQHSVETAQGDLVWDYLILALGVSYDWDAVPGSRAAHSFYDRETSLRLQQRLSSFEQGSIVIAIAGSPYRCPPAPFEAALMIDANLRKRGVRPQVSLTLAIPEPQPLGVAGPEASARMKQLLAERDVTLLTQKRVVRVSGSAMEFEDGTELGVDVPITVPLHRMPTVVAASGIANGAAFVPVDRDSLETRVQAVFAIGDVNGIPVGDKAVPKAGVFASAQGRHAAAIIASRLGAAPDPGTYSGVGECFLMLGGGEGARLGGDFFASGGPDVALGAISHEGARAKHDFEADWSLFLI